MMTTVAILPREIKKAVTACRRELREGVYRLEEGDVLAARNHFELAQHYAFQAKDLTNGGTFRPE